MRSNCTIMFANGSHIEIIYFSRSPNVLDNHSKVFETPKGIPPIPDHDHAIHLILGSVPPNIRPKGGSVGICSKKETCYHRGIVATHKGNFKKDVSRILRDKRSW